MALARPAVIGWGKSRDLARRPMGGREAAARSDVTPAAAIREPSATAGGGRTPLLRTIRSFHLSLVHVCHVLASVLVFSFRSSFLAASEVLSGVLRVLARRVLPPKMAAEDNNAVDNINHLNTRKNFVCGVVEGENPRLGSSNDLLPPYSH